MSERKKKYFLRNFHCIQLVKSTKMCTNWNGMWYYIWFQIKLYVAKTIGNKKQKCVHLCYFHRFRCTVKMKWPNFRCRWSTLNKVKQSWKSSACLASIYVYRSVNCNTKSIEDLLLIRPKKKKSALSKSSKNDKLTVKIGHGFVCLHETKKWNNLIIFVNL